ncbi:lectin-like protein [Anaerosporobacter faecicola]|uniref:lectin-like protein n=1 Tax=Anaerosporobacter faecicola TaxID=2718714 RepID=UPI00143BC243|nr:lectin-like protein [Anaerosporobacter faecicola]
MYCKNCGTQNMEGNNFCRNCGTRLTEPTVDTQTQPMNEGVYNYTQPEAEIVEQAVQPETEIVDQAIQQETEVVDQTLQPDTERLDNTTQSTTEGYYSNSQPNEGIAPSYQQNYNMAPENIAQGANNPNLQMNMGKSKRVPKKLWFGLGAVAIALAAFLIFWVNKKPTIDLNKYIIITCEGYDGYGKADISIDWDAIEEKYGDKVKFTKKAKTEYGEFVRLVRPLEILHDYVDIDLENTSNLSNGDRIAYTWDIDANDISKYIGCKVKFSNGKYKVSGLTAIGEFDPFEGVEITFRGVAPDGQAEILYNGEIMSAYDFYCDNTTGLSNGDTITVYIDSYDMEYYAETYGKVPTVTEKKYTVSGLSGYVSSISDLNEDIKKNLQSQSEDIIADYTSAWSSEAFVDSVTYMGDYMQTPKTNYSGAYNLYSLVYKISSHVRASSSYPAVKVVQYYEVKFPNIIANADGSYDVDFEYYYTPLDTFTKDAYYGEESYSYDRYYYYGYETLADLKQACEYYYGDEYNFEWNVEDVKEASNSDDFDDAIAYTEGIHTYDVFMGDMTWEEANQACMDAGGHLVTFETNEEYEYVLSSLELNQSNYYYVGGKCVDDQYYWLSPGEWHTEEALEGREEWMKGEPSYNDGDTVEDRMGIFYYKKEKRWVWNDVANDLLDKASNFSGKLGYICEYE